MATQNTNEDNTDQPTEPSATPSTIDWGALVAADSGSTTWGLPEGYNYPERPYLGASTPELEQSSLPNITITPVKRTVERLPSGRRIRTPEESGGGNPVYRGSNLVGPDGKIVRDPYMLDNSSVVGELFSGDMSNIRVRRGVMNVLYSLGMYSSTTGPSTTGTQSRDISAFRQLLLLSNSMGYTWDVTLTMLQSNPDFTRATNGSYGAGGGGGRRAGTDDELALVFANATHDMLGRAPTNKEVRDYIRAYRSGGMSPTATAQTLVSESAGPEEDAYGYAQMAELMTRMLGGD